jgi:hypothetical protein
MPQDIQTVSGKAGIQYPYLAVICGEEHAVKGWRDGNLLTGKGEFVFNPLHGDRSIESARLVEVALLQLDEKGEWLLNGHHLKMLEYLPAGNRLSGITSREDLRLHKGEIHAVAWVQAENAEDIIRLLDTILDSWKTASQPDKIKEMFSTPYHQATIGLGNFVSDFTVFKDWGDPIWLTKFQPVAKTNQNLDRLEMASADSAKVPVKALKPTKHKANKTRQPKQVARFEDDFSIAVIPQKGRADVLLTIENELRDLIKKIVAAGGRQPRTKLRSDKLDTYQPEKLLKSKIAKSLTKAGLLGTSKAGRTTVFWAKPHAG